MMLSQDTIGAVSVDISLLGFLFLSTQTERDRETETDRENDREI